MRRADLIVGLALGAVFVCVAGFLYVTWFVFPAFRLRPTQILVSAAVLAGLFLVRGRLGTYPASANEVLRQIAYQFRLRGHRVGERPGYIAVRIGQFAALKVRAEPVDDRADISYQLDASPSGWALLVLLVLFDWTAVVAAGAGVYLFLVVRSFAARVLRPLIPTGTGVTPAPPGPPDDPVRATLLDALAEGHRLATEAYEAERSTFWNFELFIVSIGFLLWGFVLLTLGINASLPTFSGADAILAAALVASVAAGGVSAMVHGRVRQRLEASRTWSDRLSAALTREIQRNQSEGTEPSSLEMLAEAAAHVPDWLGARQKAGILNDPGPGILFATAIALTLTAFLATIWMTFIGHVLLALLLGIATLALIGGAELGRRTWERHEKDLFARGGLQWERRLASLRDHMEGFLREL